jgi:hypothetical protein
MVFGAYSLIKDDEVLDSLHWHMQSGGSVGGCFEANDAGDWRKGMRELEGQTAAGKLCDDCEGRDSFKVETPGGRLWEEDGISLAGRPKNRDGRYGCSQAKGLGAGPVLIPAEKARSQTEQGDKTKKEEKPNSKPPGLPAIACELRQ